PKFLRGAALAQKKDAAGAVKAYREALAIDPKLAEVRNELGTVLADQKLTDEAIAEFKAAVAAKPDLIEAWFNLGHAHVAKGDLDVAEKTLRDGMEKNPRSLAVRLALAKTLAAAKKCAEVETTIAPLPPSQEDVKSAMGEIRRNCPAKK